MKEELLQNIDSHEIQTYQQNRYPMLFIDHVKEVMPGKYAKGHKCFSYNEWFFPIHFEDEPVVPGFVLIEMLTQMFLMTILSFEETKGKKTASFQIDNVRIQKKITPGMRVDIKADCISYRRGVGKGRAVGYVDEEEACSADLTIVIPDILNQYKPK